MLPTLRPGRIVVGLRIERIKQGNIVIVSHEGLEKIKRITGIRPGEVFVIGDNQEQSKDSRQFGWLDNGKVLAKIYWPINL
jgi:hypothetical protein